VSFSVAVADPRALPNGVLRDWFKSGLWVPINLNTHDLKTIFYQVMPKGEYLLALVKGRRLAPST
jgi:hypothetical protein